MNFTANRSVSHLVLLTVALVLTGCQTVRAMPGVPLASRLRASSQVKAPAPIAQATVAEAALLSADPHVVFLDVRMPEEYVVGHAKGAILSPLPDLDRWAAKLDKKAPTLLICRSGSRSMKAAQALVERGFTQITNVQGGTLAWEAAGNLPIVVGPNPLER